MQDAPHPVTTQPVTTLTRAIWLVREYCQSPQFDEIYEMGRRDRTGPFARYTVSWTIGDALQFLLAQFETDVFTPRAERQARVFTRSILELHEGSTNVQARAYETEFVDVDGTRYDIMQVVGFIEQALGSYPFTYWNGQRQVSYNPLRTPSPDSMAHSNGRRTPQPHDMRTDALLLMRSVLKNK